MRKIQRQLPVSVSSPPIGGPSAAATEPTAPQAAIAGAHRWGGKAASSSPSAAGIMAAAAAPCTARAAISAPADGATAHQADATANAAVAVRYTRRRPSRSAARPNTTSSAANASAYALTTHDSAPSPARSKSPAMSGNAMLTIVTSR